MPQAVIDPRVDKMRHAARRTRCLSWDEHPFEQESKMDPEQLYERVSPKIRKFLEAMPGLAEISDKRMRVTKGVDFWAEFYEAKRICEKYEENYKWDHDEKIKVC